MDVLLAFGAALVSARLAAELFRRRGERDEAARLAWAGSLAAFALASAALAWGSAAGWDDRSFRVYYLFGGLLTALLLGAGSLLRVGVRWVAVGALLYTGVAIGVAVSVPLTSPVSGTEIPDAQEHLELVPARLLAIAGNLVGTVAAIGVAGVGLRRRPVGNGLVIAGVAVAALGSSLAGLGVGGSSLFAAVAATLLYGGFVVRR